MPSGRLPPDARARRAIYYRLAAVLRSAVEGNVVLLDVESGDVAPIIDIDEAAREAQTVTRDWYHTLDLGPVVAELLNMASSYEKKSEGYAGPPPSLHVHKLRAEQEAKDAQQPDLFAKARAS